MTVTDAVLAGVEQEPAMRQPDDEEAADRLVSMLCRRMARQHACNGTKCHHRNHRRDVAYATHLFSILLLSGSLPRSEDYNSALPYHTMTRGDARAERASFSGADRGYSS